jgi:hypothetical protein
MIDGRPGRRPTECPPRNGTLTPGTETIVASQADFDATESLKATTTTLEATEVTCVPRRDSARADFEIDCAIDGARALQSRLVGWKCRLLHLSTEHSGAPSVLRGRLGAS